MEVARHFSVVDYVLFVTFLVLPVILGIWYGFRRNLQTTSREVLLGHRNIGVLPVALALVATFLSTVSVLGYSAEIYIYGTMFLYYFLTYAIVYPTVAYVFLPTIYPLQLTSVYEYLELRFSKAVRTAASAIFFSEVLFYLPVALYAPALALTSVTGLSIHLAIVTTGLAATVYTAVGGSNAVIWTSVLQMMFIIAGVLAVIISGTISVGGVANVFTYASEGHRIQLSDFRINPHVRHSFWSLVIGGSFVICALFSVNQMSVQRYFVMPTLQQAQTVALLNIPINIVFFGLLGIAGLVVYASYRYCDPFESGAIAKPDQLLIYYVMDKLSGATGVPGLFVSALYGAGMSTLAGGSTALAAVVLEDFYKPIHRHFSGAALSENVAFRLSKIFAGVIGIVLTVLSLAVSSIKSTVVQIALSVFGITGGPPLGVFCLGMFFPFANKHGAICGILLSLALTAWLGLGAVFNGIRCVALPRTTAGCDTLNVSTNFTMVDRNDSYYLYPLPTDYGINVAPDNSSIGGLADFYKISYQYYSLFAVLVALITGVVVSLATGGQATVDPKLLSPLIRRLTARSRSAKVYVEKTAHASF